MTRGDIVKELDNLVTYLLDNSSGIINYEDWVEIKKELTENEIKAESFDIIKKHTKLFIGFDNELEFDTDNADIYDGLVVYTLNDEECKIIKKARSIPVK